MFVWASYDAMTAEGRGSLIFIGKQVWRDGKGFRTTQGHCNHSLYLEVSLYTQGAGVAQAHVL